MSQSSQSSGKINKSRMVFSCVYLLVAGLILWYRGNELFYLVPQPDSYNFDRFLWCLSSSLIGFSFLSVEFWSHSTSPFPRYITYYPVLLIVISSLVFSTCQLFEGSKGFIFYYLSFGACVVLAFLVDQFWELSTSFIKNKMN